jgi:hypothetical protein
MPLHASGVQRLGAVARQPLSPKMLALAVLLLHLAIGAFISGSGFLANFDSAVPAQPTGGGAPRYMVPGDHFEQLYRYNLPRNNIAAGRTPYWSGYQYNLSSSASDFGEGWVFFPFSMLHAAFALVIGDVAAYNLIALLSFPLVGGAMYWLTFWLTRSHAAALLSSLILALLPHRTSFLFGEMAYGMDLVFAPLILLFFEKYHRSLSLRHALLFGLFLLLYATAGIQAFYLFAVFSSPYFAVRLLQLFAREGVKGIRIGWLVLAAIPALLYMLHIRGLIGASGLDAGQAYAETQFYSPTLADAARVWSGNEKTVYLGWPMWFLAILALLFGAARAFSAAGRVLATPSVFPLVTLTFAVSYLFCFGPNLDSMLNMPVYRWFFDNVPGANGTRTPGRLMGTAGFFFALTFGIAAHIAIRLWNETYPWRLVSLGAITAVAALGIVRDYDYVKPQMVRLDPANEAYERIRGVEGIVYTIPVQREAEHYLNATFLYYAQKYGLRIFAGHSSLYPKEWNRIIGELLPINAGRFGRAEMEGFRARGITHLVAHDTPFEPSVGPFAIARLKQSPFLELIGVDEGIYAFRVNFDASGEQTVDPRRLMEESRFGPADVGKFHFLDGWYAREAYPGEKPFRWMHGARSSGMLLFGEGAPRAMRFEYKCPLEDLKVFVNGEPAPGAAVDAEGGWKAKSIDLEKHVGNRFYIELNAGAVFRASVDTREFGCMVGDILLK